MVKKLCIGLFAMVGFMHAQEIHPCAKHKMSAFSMAKAQQQKNLTDQNKYDLHYIKLDLSLDNQSTTINKGYALLKGSVTAFTNDEFVLELQSDIQLDSATVNGQIAPTSRTGDELQVFASSVLNQGDLFELEVFYHGAAPVSGGFFGGIFNETSPTWGADVTWTLSQPFSSHTWWPAKQVLTDKIDSSEVWLTVPDTLMAGSNGLLQQVVPLPNNLLRFEWKHNHPIAYYLISIAVGPYVEYNFNAPLPGSTDSVFIQNFIYNNPATLANFQSDIEMTADMMYVFSDLYGEYPYKNEKYGHCMAPLSGGMEHQTMTTQGFFTTGLTSHELGHQWFGDHVTCEDWGHIWVNEGFASYSEYLYMQTLNQNNADQIMFNFHSDVMSQTNGSVFVPVTTDENRIFSSRLTYNKGAALVHMIRYWVNEDSLFFQALKDYQIQFANQTTNAEDFISIVEASTGVLLNNFLDDWYYGEGYPTINGTFNDTNNEIVVQLTQTGSMPNVTPFFTTYLDINVEFVAGGDTTLRVKNSFNGQQFRFDIDKSVNSIRLDQDNWVLNKSDGVTRDVNLYYTQTALHDLSSLDLSIYPNPSKGSFTILGLDHEKMDAVLLDLQGKKVCSFEVVNNQVNLENLPVGLYFLQLSNEKYNSVNQIIIK